MFQARYLPDGSGVPDARGVELDGLGWALWATGSWPPSCRRPTVRRSCSGIAGLLIAARTLHWVDRQPLVAAAPSSDYWEVKETKLTTAAVLCAGLESGAELYRNSGGR